MSWRYFLQVLVRQLLANVADKTLVLWSTCFVEGQEKLFFFNFRKSNKKQNFLWTHIEVTVSLCMKLLGDVEKAGKTWARGRKVGKGLDEVHGIKLKF